MHKRTFLQAMFTAGGCCLFCRPLKNPPLILPPIPIINADERSVLPVPVEPMEDGVRPVAFDANNIPELPHQEEIITHVQADESLNRAQDFDRDYSSDIRIADSKRVLLESTVARLALVQRYLGHGNFNLLGFSDLLYFADKRPEIGGFSTEELDFIDEIFSTPAHIYGFYGDKVIHEREHRVDERDVVKVADSGHFLFRGESLEKYERLRKDIGEDLVLTSGVRNIVKQLYLFLAKTRETRGNLSRASRSIAPPGYSFHGVGDFDVGKIGLGERNFTSEFSGTLEFQRMIRLGYIDIRYTDNNALGVRFEPWHVKIA